MGNQSRIDRVLGRIEPGRREALRRILVGSAYAVPVVASFSMMSFDAAAQIRCANQTGPGCAVSVPTMSEWTLVATAGTLGVAAAWMLRRRA